MLGAYALGALDPSETTQVREHLIVCPRCRTELTGFEAVVVGLRTVSAADAAVGPLAPLAPPVLAPPTSVRRIAPGRGRLRVLAVAAAAVLVAGAGGYGIGALAAPGHEAPAASVAGVRFTHVSSATNAATGTWAEIATAQQPWGAWVRLTLHRDRVPALERCELVVHGRDGSVQVAATWQADHAGTFTVPGGVGMAPGDIAWYEVQKLDGEQLVTVSA
jgi:hypothetical protein